jgi:hypothetical protein
MPRYFFHVVDGEERLEDAEGVPLPDERAARKMAVHIAREIMAESLRNGEPIDGQVFEVADENGEVVIRMPFKSAIPN